MPISPNRRWLFPAAAAVVMLGCPQEELGPLEPCTVQGVSKEVSQSGVDKVDLLFMIDDSGSMREEQANIAVQLPHLVTILATGDLDGDGKQDFQPVSSLQLGVVTSDMGIFGADNIPTCERKLGDDGLLRYKVDASATVNGFSCADVPAATMRYQVYRPPAVEADRITEATKVANNFACVANVGTKGCGLEQHLESMWKALAPGDNDDFVEGNGHGKKVTTDDGVVHGDGQNAGFLRDEAVLAVIMVMDETDCSIKEKGKSMFQSMASYKYTPSDKNGNVAAFKDKPEGLNFRCSDETWAGELQPPEHYIEGLKSLKPAYKDRIIFAAITGIPEEAETLTVGGGDDAVQDFDKILALDAMQVYPGKNAKLELDITSALPRPACQSENGSASPGRRFVQVAKGFGQNGLVRSICKKDFKSALDQILLRISKQLTGACLPSPFNPNKDGVIECDVVEILAKDETKCDASKGRTPDGTRKIKDASGNDVEHVVCKINQVAVLDGHQQNGVGWFYDNFSSDVKKNCTQPGTQQRIAFTDGADLAPGSAASIECFQPVGGDSSRSGREAVGAACTENNKCNGNTEFPKMVCENDLNVCEIWCDSDAVCPDSWVCEPNHKDKDGKKVSVCVNPTCPPGSSG